MGTCPAVLLVGQHTLNSGSQWGNCQLQAGISPTPAPAQEPTRVLLQGVFPQAVCAFIVFR